MKNRLIIGLIVGATVFAAVFAMAASLGVTSDDLAAGDIDVIGCDANGVATSYETSFQTDAYKVTEITVSGIADDCDSQTLEVTVLDASDNIEFQDTWTVVGSGDGTDVDHTFTPVGLPASEVEHIHALIAE